jgi:hypothetical protein
MSIPRRLVTRLHTRHPPGSCAAEGPLPIGRGLPRSRRIYFKFRKRMTVFLGVCALRSDGGECKAFGRIRKIDPAGVITTVAAAKCNRLRWPLEAK